MLIRLGLTLPRTVFRDAPPRQPLDGQGPLPHPIRLCNVVCWLTPGPASGPYHRSMLKLGARNQTRPPGRLTRRRHGPWRQPGQRGGPGFRTSARGAGNPGGTAGKRRPAPGCGFADLRARRRADPPVPMRAEGRAAESGDSSQAQRGCGGRAVRDLRRRRSGCLLKGRRRSIGAARDVYSCMVADPTLQMNQDFPQRLAQYRSRVERVLEKHLELPDSGTPRLREAMRYSALGGGKRLRPILVYMTGESLGASLALLNEPAAAVELIHVYSLVHNDMPAMDDDDL